MVLWFIFKYSKVKLRWLVHHHPPGSNVLILLSAFDSIKLESTTKKAINSIESAFYRILHNNILYFIFRHLMFQISLLSFICYRCCFVLLSFLKWCTCFRKKFENRFSDQKWNNSLLVRMNYVYMHERKRTREEIYMTACCSTASRVSLIYENGIHFVRLNKSRKTTAKNIFFFIFRYILRSD